MKSSDLTGEIQAALKSKDSRRTSALRLLSTALRNAEVERKGDLSEEESIDVIARELKRRDEAAEEYRKAGREDRAEAEEADAAIFREFLPPPLEDDELDALIRDVISKTGASNSKDLGKVMKELMPSVRGRADGRKVTERVRALLGS